MDELVFNVARDEDGNFCACAETDGGALCTDGRTLDELLVMIRDVIVLYNEDSEVNVTSFSMRFSSPSEVAA